MNAREPLRAHPLTIRLRTDDGRTVEEPLVLVGNVIHPSRDPSELNAYGIDTSFGQFNGGRWERCLFFEGGADLLAKLAEEGSFPYPFEAIPSKAALIWLEATQANRTPPEQPLEHWLQPATIQDLAHAVEDKLLKEGWLRSANQKATRPTRAGGGGQHGMQW